MKWFSHPSITCKILMGLGVALAANSGVGIFLLQQQAHRRESENRAVVTSAVSEPLAQDLNAAFRKIAADLQSALDLESNDAGNRKADTLDSSSLLIPLAGIVLAVLAGMVWANLIARRIARRLREADDAMRRLTARDLTGEVLEAGCDDEISAFAVHVNELEGSVREMIEECSNGVERILCGSDEALRSAGCLERGQNKKTEQTGAVAMQQLQSTVAKLCDGSNKASEGVRQISDDANKSETLVSATLNQMQAIAEAVSKSAKRIEALGKSSEQIGRVLWPFMRSPARPSSWHSMLRSKQRGPGSRGVASQLWPGK
jgi:methyl-accepting chemotaxis protein